MTTTLTHPETLDAAYALLAEGEGQITAGRYREGSANVYQAAFSALREVAARRGWPCETYDDAHDVIYRLDDVEPPPEDVAEAIEVAFERVDDPLPVYSLLFTTVLCFKLHSATVFRDGVSLPVYFWEPEDYVKSLPLVKNSLTCWGWNYKPKLTMTRSEHLQSALDFLTAMATLRTMPRQGQAVAEMIWGAR